MEIGGPEIVIILVVVILLFGVGRIGKIGGELGKSIREFRRGIQGDDTPAVVAPVAGQTAAAEILADEPQAPAQAPGTPAPGN